MLLFATFFSGCYLPHHSVPFDVFDVFVVVLSIAFVAVVVVAVIGYKQNCSRNEMSLCISQYSFASLYAYQLKTLFSRYR